jgi:hypothetical protein
MLDLKSEIYTAIENADDDGLRRTVKDFLVHVVLYVAMEGLSVETLLQ